MDHPIRFEVAPELDLRILDLKFCKPVDCAQIDALKRNGFLQSHADVIQFRTSPSSLEYKSLLTVFSNNCVETSYFAAIIVVGVVLVLILVIVSVAVFYRFWAKRQPQRQLNMVNPDGKTYRETQIMIQIENAGLLKTNL